MTKRKSGPSNVTFGGPDGDAIDWAFGVPPAFRAALDIDWRETGKYPRGAWLRGDPPARSFSAGDMFYRPGKARGMVWADALDILEMHIQITAATPSMPVDGGITAGHVAFDCAIYQFGAVLQMLRRECSQARFEELLKTGELPPVGLFDNPAAR